MVIILNKILWAIATVFIVILGIYFTWRLKGIQFDVKNIIRSFKPQKEDQKGISPFSSLMMVLAGRIGVGSIAGVALAIYIGGVGSIFWMWIIAFIAASSTFVETVLGMKYKEIDENDIYKGGPSYYMKNGLGYKKLGAVYAIIVLIAYVGGFLGIQSNTIAKSLESIISLPIFIIASIICILTTIIIFGGVTKIARVTNKLVPTMTILYVGVASYIVIKNINFMPYIVQEIITNAFQLDSFLGGFLPTMVIGIQRGIFSNEAGLGTGSLASSTTADTHVIRNGFVQVIGIYITTLFICTATAFVILTSDYQSMLFQDINGIEITQYAFSYHLGNFGNYIVFGSIVLFSFSTILTGYYYGESSLKYFFHKLHPRLLVILKISAIFVIFLGCFLSPAILWNIVDLFVASLAIINMPVLLMLLPKVEKELIQYRKKKGNHY